MMTIDEIILENARHNALLSDEPDPIKGDAADPSRRPYSFGGTTRYLPADMLGDPKLPLVSNERDFARLRFRYDFPFWAATCVVINDKITSRDIPLRLNRPQRRLVSLLERERLAGRPLRLIMLKARQWGGSTLIQIYFAWIQIIHRRNWNSLICAHVKDTAATIRGMYTKLLARYPEEYWEEDDAPEFRPFERMTNTRIIQGRGCRVTVCSSENQEATRGQDYALAHLSEVAFWKDSTLHNPADLLRSVASGIATKPLSFIAMESTANGVGNFFHREWLRANTPGKSDKIPFFVPWHEIEINRSGLTCGVREFWDSLDSYERELWELHGCTLEAIKWYHDKRLGFPDHRSRGADYSVIAVLDRGAPGARPEIVAQWRGHIDHDLLARKAEAIARFYNDAVLAIESNSWESSSEGQGRFILDSLSRSYHNLYFRQSEGGAATSAGFHVNVRTKAAIIANLVAYVREHGYVERSFAACDELLQYESLPDGSYAASRGCHDDILMTRAIALYIHAIDSPSPESDIISPDIYLELLNRCR